MSESRPSTKIEKTVAGTLIVLTVVTFLTDMVTPITGVAAMASAMVSGGALVASVAFGFLGIVYPIAPPPRNVLTAQAILAICGAITGFMMTALSQ